MTARTVMVQGSSSSAGTSLVACALCRCYARRGLSVAPYKSQNMSNNSSPAGPGLEIGRAQALQAAAAKVRPSVDMNPILLKPESDSTCQVVALGRPSARVGAIEYGDYAKELWPMAAAALDRLREGRDLVVIEGAGSPAELNLRERDFANMAVALRAKSPVLLVGDIDRGGIFAQLCGTLDLLAQEERALVRGLIVNKFRGDPSLFSRGVGILEERTGLPVLGVLPFIPSLRLSDEDAQGLEPGAAPGPLGAEGFLDIAVPLLPRLSNFDDLDALGLDGRAMVRYVSRPEELGNPDAIVIPGSKATRADLAWLRDSGLADGLRWLHRLGVPILGLCGGYQILGLRLEDPKGIEGDPGSTEGLGLLPISTRLEPGKLVRSAWGTCLGGPGDMAPFAGLEVEGYEIHSGVTGVEGGGAYPLLSLVAARAGAAATDGFATADGLVMGTYLHGLFDLPGFRLAWLDLVARRAGKSGLPDQGPLAGSRMAEAREAELERLADVFEEHMDMGAISALIGL
jgi:adenosylcobyric acid synthase